MEHRWAGPIAVTLNASSVFGELAKNVYAATVCQGLGTTRSTLFGMMIADKLTARSCDTLESLESKARPNQLPPRILNRIGVPAYLKWTHWRAGRDL